jgi:beta-glucanase (GH16 family)
MQRKNLPASLSSLAAALLSAVVLSACGGGSGGATPSTAAGASAAAGVSASAGAPAPTATAPTAPAPIATVPAVVPDTQTASTMTPYGLDASRYTLSFSEEFNGNSLNTNVWNDAIWYEQSDATQNYAVEDGKLKIWPQRNASGNFVNRTIDTDGKFYQTYGYFEMEAKLPKGKGLWPAFWLFNHDRGDRPEIDIMEAYSGGGAASGWSDSALNPTNYAANLWEDNTQGRHLGETKMREHSPWQGGVRLDEGFHKYGALVEPDGVTFFFDGKQMGSKFRTTFYNMRMYIILDLWFGSASGQPDNSTPTGKTNSYEVNYVRAWRMK